MGKKQKRLHLHRDTLRRLDRAELRGVAGAKSKHCPTHDVSCGGMTSCDGPMSCDLICVHTQPIASVTPGYC